jgi:hypothetical protein
MKSVPAEQLYLPIARRHHLPRPSERPIGPLWVIFDWKESQNKSNGDQAVVVGFVNAFGPKHARKTYTGQGNYLSQHGYARLRDNFPAKSKVAKGMTEREIQSSQFA